MMRNTWQVRAIITVFLAVVLPMGLIGFHTKSPALAPGKEISTQETGQKYPLKQPTPGGRLVIGVQQEPERLSEILNATATNNLICNLIFSKFVKYNDRLELIPDLIEAIPTQENGGISSDHLTYTYRIRKDARWHDGRPVTSHDVKFTFDIIMDPAINVESREGWDVVTGVDTPDDQTVIFHLRKPFPDFVSEAFFDEPVLPKHLLDGERGDKFHSAGFHHAPVGSGPFSFVEWVPASHIVLKKSDTYYSEGPYLDQIIFKFTPDENTLLVQLKTGEINVFDNASIAFLDQIEKIPGVRVHTTPTLMYEHLDLNTQRPILKDKRVRQAIAYATNKIDIAEKVYGGWAEVAALDEHPSSMFYNKDAASKVKYDPAKARLLLHQAGWVDADGDGILEKDGRKLVLTISATSGNRNRERTEVVLREQYRKVGIDLRIKNYNPSVMYGSYEDGGILKRGDFDIALYAWLSSPEPATKESLYATHTVPPNGMNHPRIQHAELDSLLEAGSDELDVARRIETYHRVSSILVDEVPVVPLFWYTAVDASPDNLHNFKPNPTQSADTWNANTWFFVD